MSKVVVYPNSMCLECGRMLSVALKKGELISTHYNSVQFPCKNDGKRFEVPIVECKEIVDADRDAKA